ncbi:15690_t:CDS:2 [Dentiscutata heterogama]|uniref:15690_t:CDS:1 n=1 Tax=Dentiscutata heterogama TaxID=1316150 RepID=A0ACA9K2W1_9GLOM|nr:15690_t:CDS:2 [Dentiscutata heterogama]
MKVNDNHNMISITFTPINHDQSNNLKGCLVGLYYDRIQIVDETISNSHTFEIYKNFEENEICHARVYSISSNMNEENDNRKKFIEIFGKILKVLQQIAQELLSLNFELLEPIVLTSKLIHYLPDEDCYQIQLICNNYTLVAVKVKVKLEIIL